jgi:hypothetical protein
VSRPLHSANDRAKTVEHGAICLHLGEVQQEIRTSLGDPGRLPTGTLTKGRPELTDVISAGVPVAAPVGVADGGQNDELIGLVASAERSSETPWARPS